MTPGKLGINSRQSWAGKENPVGAGVGQIVRRPHHSAGAEGILRGIEMQSTSITNRDLSDRVFRDLL